MVVPPGGFFTFMKMLPNVSFIIKIIKKSVFVSTNGQNFIVSIETHPLKAWFWKDLEQISPVFTMNWTFKRGNYSGFVWPPKLIKVRTIGLFSNMVQLYELFRQLSCPLNWFNMSLLIRSNYESCFHQFCSPIFLKNYWSKKPLVN